MSFFQEVVYRLKKVPTISNKSAERIAFNLIKIEKKEVQSLIEALQNLVEKTFFCSVCGLLSEYNPCKICQSTKRDKKIICIVSKLEDAIAIEKCKIYNGLYHVISGLLSPVNDIFEKDLHLEKLLKRIISPTSTTAPVTEIIFAFEQSIEADATINFIKEKIIKEKVTEKLNSKSFIFSKIKSGIQSSKEEVIQEAIRNRHRLYL